MNRTGKRLGSALGMPGALTTVLLALVVAASPALAEPPHRAGQRHTSSSPAKPRSLPAVSSHRAKDADDRAHHRGSAAAPSGHSLSDRDDRAHDQRSAAGGVRRSSIGRHSRGSPRPAINSVPSAPNGVTAIANPDGSVTVGWNTAAVNRSAGDVFEIGRRLPGESDFTKVGETSGGSFTDQGAGGRAVEYQVVARRSWRYSGVSGVVSVTPTNPGTAPQAGAGKTTRPGGSVRPSKSVSTGKRKRGT